MLILKLQDHMNANAEANQLFNNNPYIETLAPSKQRKINELANTGLGYMLRYGDANLVNELTDTGDIFNKTLLISLGHRLSNKMALEKTSSHLHNEKEHKQAKEVDERLKEEAKAVKDAILKLQMYHVQKRTGANNGTGKNEDVSIATDLLDDFQSKLSSEISKPVGKKININKMKLALASSLESALENEKKLQMKMSFRDDEPEIVKHYEPKVEHQIESPHVALTDEAIKNELERFAKQNFHLKEVASKTLEMSLDGDIPRAVITDLSYEQIFSLVSAMEERFNGPDLEETMDAPMASSSLLSDVVNAVKPEFKQKGNVAPKITTRKLPNGQVIQTRMLPKPQPTNKAAKKNKPKPQARVAQSQATAAAKTAELSKFYAHNQDYHYNYIDVERFELDEMYVNSVYEAGARNPYKGRLFSCKVKNMHSDLRYENMFKRRLG